LIADDATAARSREDRVAWLIFAALIAMAVLVGSVLLIEERPYRDVVEDGATRRVYEGHGVPHPDFAPVMEHGGDGRERHAEIRLFAWAIAMLSVVFGTAACYLGSLRRAGPSPLKWSLIGAGLVVGIAITAMFTTYWHMLGNTTPFYFLGFPTATAWMIFGVTLFPLLMVGMYVTKFDSWFAPRDINDRLQNICESARRRAGEEP